MAKVIAIAAVGKNGVIGRGAELPWNIPEDMRFFRNSTRDQLVIMGRKTYQSLGKALPKRENGVITRDSEFKTPDARIFKDLGLAIDQFKKIAKAGQNVFVIGGAEIYRLSFPFLDEIWLTEIDADFEGDVFFPDYSGGVLNRTEFIRSESTEQNDFESSPYHYRFSIFKRIPK
jgi:dihydrofolate reductase